MMVSSVRRFSATSSSWSATAAPSPPATGSRPYASSIKSTPPIALSISLDTLSAPCRDNSSPQPGDGRLAGARVAEQREVDRLRHAPRGRQTLFAPHAQVQLDRLHLDRLQPDQCHQLVERWAGGRAHLALDPIPSARRRFCRSATGVLGSLSGSADRALGPPASRGRCNAAGKRGGTAPRRARTVGLRREGRLAQTPQAHFPHRPRAGHTLQGPPPRRPGTAGQRRSRQRDRQWHAPTCAVAGPRERVWRHPQTSAWPAPATRAVRPCGNSEDEIDVRHDATDATSCALAETPQRRLASASKYSSSSRSSRSRRSACASFGSTSCRSRAACIAVRREPTSGNGSSRPTCSASRALQAWRTVRVAASICGSASDSPTSRARARHPLSAESSRGRAAFARSNFSRACSRLPCTSRRRCAAFSSSSSPSTTPDALAVRSASSISSINDSARGSCGLQSWLRRFLAPSRALCCLSISVASACSSAPRLLPPRAVDRPRRHILGEELKLWPQSWSIGVDGPVRLIHHRPSPPPWPPAKPASAAHHHALPVPPFPRESR
eukprot:scaffold320393_cov28-Tisochrysis_lutea.AAC.6